MSVTREELHFRRLDYRGYRRSDGLFEVEARLTDRKPADFQVPHGGSVVPAHEPIHDHAVRVAFGPDMVICEVHATMHSFPYRGCLSGNKSLEAMIGARIGRGWRDEVRKRLPAAENCTHLREMLIPLATAAFQTLNFLLLDRPEDVDARGKPAKIDTCAAFGASGDLVQVLWPEHHCKG